MISKNDEDGHGASGHSYALAQISDASTASAEASASASAELELAFLSRLLERDLEVGIHHLDDVLSHQVHAHPLVSGGPRDRDRPPLLRRHLQGRQGRGPLVGFPIVSKS